MSFVKKAVPPPDVEEGDVLKAHIVDIKKVTSQWKDDEGNPKEQLQFDLELENGYKARSWCAFYEKPSDKSKLGKLALKLSETIKKDFSNVDEFLVALKQFGNVFLKCKGFREYEEELYPNFDVVTDKLPTFQEKIAKGEPEAKTFDAKELLARFKDALTFGLPLNDTDWNRNLLVEERLFLLKEQLVERREGLYFFTEKASALFH